LALAASDTKDSQAPCREILESAQQQKLKQLGGLADKCVISVSHRMLENPHQTN
jgi:hypothetical protein